MVVKIWDMIIKCGKCGEELKRNLLFKDHVGYERFSCECVRESFYWKSRDNRVKLLLIYINERLVLNDSAIYKVNDKGDLEFLYKDLKYRDDFEYICGIIEKIKGIKMKDLLVFI
jgi:hypothetical protein